MSRVNRGDVDWGAIRAEYLAGGVGQRVLARKWGLSYSTLRRRAEAGGWARMKQEEAGREAGAIAPSTDEAGDSDNALQRAEAGAIAPSTDEAGDSDIALRLRRKLLKRLEKMADEIPDGAVTEYKTQDDSAVKLFKLRDLTAAYKELACDLPLEGEDRDGVKVVVDV